VVKPATLALLATFQEEEPHPPPSFAEVKASLRRDKINTLYFGLVRLTIVIWILIQDAANHPVACLWTALLDFRIMLVLIDVMRLKLVIVVLTNAMACVYLQLA
jgi:hypothetical protein